MDEIDMQPEISLVIPIQNASRVISNTCESILTQKNCQWEAIFVDAGSQDHTVPIIRSYNEKRFRIQSQTLGSVFSLMNRGILMAQGRYVNVLLEGCTYISPTSLASCLYEINKANDPDLFYTASYVGDESGRMHLYYLWQLASQLQEGFQPALLQACFFKTDLFSKVGYFRQDLQRRSGLDFFCRLLKQENLKTASQMRVYVEMPHFPAQFLNPWPTYKETFFVIYNHFGFLQALRWLISCVSRAKFGRKFLLDIVVPEYK